jgi:DNA-binding SARP family transcriptional activator/WD40 repeat protein
MEYRLLGPIQVADEDGVHALGGPRMRRLLTLLVVHADTVVSVDRLIEAVWGEEPPSGADTTLQTYISRLRRALGGDDRIINRPPGYVLVTSGDGIDARSFERAIADARDIVSNGDLGLAVARLDDALKLWSGPAIAEFASEDWASPEARRLEELRTVAREELAAARLEQGDASGVVGELEQLVAAEPLRDRPRALLMTALYRCGRHAEALRVFQAHRTLLGDEMGLEPSSEMRTLERQILDQDPVLARGPRGRTLRGYRLIERLGDGPHGEVWLAVQPAVGREVAIKIIGAQHADDPNFIRRFETEAQIVARLEHPHIVPLYDYWREAGGAYLVMRYLRGGTLATALHERHTVDETLTIVADVADALGEAHRGGVIHRDLTASNILLDTLGAAYVADFGIALEPGGTQSIHADLEALGFILAELLAAPHPLTRDADPEAALRKLRPELPAHVVDIVVQASRGGADGFASAADLGHACDVARTTAPRPRTASRGGERNPYKGLRSFEEADTGDFFGRETLLAGVVERLAGGGRFVALVGASGSGKSSLLRAGVVPAVRRGAMAGAPWFVTTMTPGEDPIAELAMAIGRVSVRPIAELRTVIAEPGGFGRAVRAALPDDGSQLLLVVDQLEEIFTLCSDEEARASFLNGIAQAAFDERARLRVVTALRADAYDRPLQYRTFALLLDANTITVMPPNPEELEAAITGPAARVGVDLEHGMLSRLVGDLVDRPAALALLQFTMAELYDQRRSGLLTLDAYRLIGGVSGALAHRADAIHEALSGDERAIARRAFGRLVVVGDNSIEGRRRPPVDQLVAGSDRESVMAVLDRFADQRLLTFDRDPITRAPTVEIAHEALINAWPQLRAWVDEDRSGLRLLQHLETAATHWEASGRDDADLYRGSRLAAAIDWTDTHGEMVNPIENAFLSAARDVHGAELRAARRSTRRLRRRLGVASVALVLAIIAGAVAVVQQRSAGREHAEAIAQRQLADEKSRTADANAALAKSNEELATQQKAAAATQAKLAADQRQLADARLLADQARGLGSSDRSLALLLALESYHLNSSFEVQSLLAEPLLGAPNVSRLIPSAATQTADITLDGTMVVTGGDDTSTAATLWQRSTDGALARLSQLHVSGLPGATGVAFDHSGKRLVTTGADLLLRLWDISDPKAPVPIGVSWPTPGRAFTPSWNSDDSLVGAGGTNGFVALWSVGSDGATPLIGGPVAGYGFAFSPTEPMLLAAFPLIGDGQLVDLRTGFLQTLHVDAKIGCCGFVAFSFDGARLAVAAGDAGIAIFDRATGTLETTLPFPYTLIFNMRFSPDGKYFAASDDNGAVVALWDATNWHPLAQFDPGVGFVTEIRFPADGTILAFGGHALAILDPRRPSFVTGDVVDLPVKLALDSTNSMIADNSGIYLAMLSGVARVGIGTHTIDAIEEDGRDASSLAPGPFDSTIAVGRADGRVDVLDTASLHVRLTMGALGHRVRQLAVRSARTPLIAAASDNELVMWAIEDGKPHELYRQPFGADFIVAGGVAFSPDGSTLVSSFFSSPGVRLDVSGNSVQSVEPGLRWGGPIAYDHSGALLLALSGLPVSLYDSSTLNPTEDLGTAGGGGITSAIFTPDDKLAIAAGYSGAITILDVATRQTLGSPLDAGRGATMSLAFLAGTSTLVSEHVDPVNATAHLVFWDLDPKSWTAHACEVAGRNLTKAEWSRYLPSYDYHTTCSQWPTST